MLLWSFGTHSLVAQSLGRRQLFSRQELPQSLHAMGPKPGPEEPPATTRVEYYWHERDLPARRVRAHLPPEDPRRTFHGSIKSDKNDHINQIFPLPVESHQGERSCSRRPRIPSRKDPVHVPIEIQTFITRSGAHTESKSQNTAGGLLRKGIPAKKNIK